MKTLIKNSLFLLFLFEFNLAYSQYTFSKEYSGPGNDWEEFYSICLSGDGGFVGVGATESFGSRATLLSKTNNAGLLQWANHFGAFTSSDVPYAIRKVSTGGYLLAGERYIFASTDDNPYMIRTDDNGNILWQKTIIGSADMYFRDVIETKDSGFLFCGTYSPTGAPSTYDCAITKTDSLGNILWTKKFGGSSDNFLYSIAPVYDNGFILSGYVTSGMGRLYVAKIDSVGTLEWVRNFYSTGGSCRPGEYGSVKCTPDSGYVVAGFYGSSTSINDAWLIKMDSLGNPLWTKTYGGPSAEHFKSIEISPDGGFILAGSGVFDDPDGTGFLLKTNNSGVPEWNYKYGDSTIFHSVKCNSDGGYVVGGYKDYVTAGTSRDALIVKTDALGQSSICNTAFTMVVDSTPAYSTNAGIDPSSSLILTSSNMTLTSNFFTPLEYIYCAAVMTGITINENLQINVFPNPSLGEFTFSNLDKESAIEIYDILGKCILKTNSTKNSHTIDLTNKASGVYFYRVMNGENIFCEKIIKQ